MLKLYFNSICIDVFLFRYYRVGLDEIIGKY